MKLKSPITKYKNEPIYITLPFGDKSFASVYKQLGWGIDRHNGLDCVNSIDPLKAYGSPVLATQDGVVQKVEYETSITAKGNGIVLEGLPFIDGDKKKLLFTVYWHLSDVSVKAGDFVKAGQRIGSLGNSGYSVGNSASPMKGTHLHFMVYEYEMKDGWQLCEPDNGAKGAIDPIRYLEDGWDKNAPIYDPTWIEHSWGITLIIEKSINALKKIFGLK